MLSAVQLSEILWSTASPALLSMGFFRQEYWSRFPFPPPRTIPDPESNWNPQLLCPLHYRQILNCDPLQYIWASLVAQLVKNLPAIQETGFDPWVGKIPLEKGKATHFSILAWRIPGTGDPGGLPSVASQSRTRLKRLSSSSLQLDFFSKRGKMGGNLFYPCLLKGKKPLYN